jgi:hypothetical protein
VYTGEFKDDKMHGTGTMQEENGNLFKQFYAQGKLILNKHCISAREEDGSTSNKAVGVIVLNEYDTK